MAKTATIHLLDGDLTGSLKCSLGHWGVVVYKIPHELLNERSTAKKYEKALSTLKQCGIYFLFGKSTSDKYERGVYVGQAVTRANGRGVLGRVMEHDDIDWSEVVIFVSDNEDEHPLEPGLRYLERRFYELAKEANRYDLLNGNNPNSGYPTTFLKSNLEDFIDYAKIALYALGYNVLEPRPQKEVVDNPNPPAPVVELSLHMKYGKGEADGKYYSSDKFVVLKGSKINPNTTRTCRNTTIKQREDNADKIRNYKLIADITFKSPSAAASFVAGADLSGRRHWLDADGTLLGKLLSGKSIPHQPSTVEGRLLSLAYTPKTLKKTFKASGKYISDKEFILLKGSEFCPVEIPKCRDDVRKIRRKHADKIIDGKLISDISFGSPSTAASFVCGAQRNGYTSWRNKAGIPLGKLLEELSDEEPDNPFTSNLGSMLGENYWDQLLRQRSRGR